jgi:hypothetical protein
LWSTQLPFNIFRRNELENTYSEGEDEEVTAELGVIILEDLRDKI